jgi:Lon protease-like protein
LTTLAERYSRTADLPQRIPVFPLRRAILLPRATLPLNVFEPRYLEMLDDVMSGPRVLAIVQPAGGDEEDESPPGRSSTCVASAVSAASPPTRRRMTAG